MLQRVPNELLYVIIDHLDSEKDINSLVRASRHLYANANDVLYRGNALRSGISALLWAARQGIPETTQYALNNSVGISDRVQVLHEALAIAVQAGFMTVAAILLAQQDIDPNFQHQCQREKFRMSFLAIAAAKGYEDMVHLLLSARHIDPNVGDGKGRPPITYAGMRGHHAVVKILLATPGVDPNVRDESGRTPITWAVTSGSEASVSEFISRSDVDVNASVDGHILQKGWTPLMYAANRGLTAMVKMLLETPGIDVHHSATYGKTVLHFAAKSGADDVVRLLLRKGIDPDPKDFNGYTPLYLAALGGHLSTVKLLYEAGADPNAVVYHTTPLTETVCYGHTTAVAKFLLQTGKVDLAFRSGNNNRTPLSLAAENGQREIIEMLLQEEGHGNPDTTDSKGRTALSYAVERGDLEIATMIMQCSSPVDLHAADSEALPNPEIIVEFQPLDAKDVVFNVPQKDIKCGGNDPKARTYNSNHIWQTTVATFQRIKNNTHVPEKDKNGWPHKTNWKEYEHHDRGHIVNLKFPKMAVGCSKDNETWDFPILEDGIYDGKQDTKDLDRVIIRRIGKQEMGYCGIATQVGAEKKMKDSKATPGQHYWTLCDN
ncbi:ankyrin repeat-containing domain protein [Aspergillus ambiguus]|uniref:ankyrin repeat domain-containing protein n=1 Tax=Aspergillus ambiguus TaxID=176160 RepID=UPI003CCCC375